LKQVWRVKPSGRKDVIVRDVHAHELAGDATGAVSGEDVEWLGGDHYRHRIWRWSPDGRVTNVMPWTEGFSRNYGFARDARGATYGVDCTLQHVCTILKNANGRTTGIAVIPRQINWIAAAPNGEVYLADGEYLRRITTPGRVDTVARIGHQLMGVALDPAGNVYVAAHAERTLFRVTPAGRVEPFAKSIAPWAPSGVGVGRDGKFWLLEWNGADARVRPIS
jgi:hypothetical protein